MSCIWALFSCFKQMDIKEAVYYAEFNWTLVLSTLTIQLFNIKPVVKFPAVRRDLVLLIDEQVEFDAIRLKWLETILKDSRMCMKVKNLAKNLNTQDENKT